MNLSLSQSDEVPRDLLDDHIVGVLREIATGLAPEGRAVDLIVIGDDRIRQINRDFRDKDVPTDVISFSYLEDDGPADDEDIVGEIYVSHETLSREAGELGVDWKHLFLRIGVHGLLHVIGYGHGTDADAERMEQQERELLSQHLDSGAVEALF